MLQTSESAKDRRLNILLVVASLTAVATIIFALVAGPKILSSASTTRKIDEANEVTSCRATFRIDVDDATTELQRARAGLDRNTSEGFEILVVAGDREHARQVLGSAPILRKAVEYAEDELVDVTDRYRRLIALSRTDTKTFLGICQDPQEDD